VDAVNDGVGPSFRNLGTVQTVHDGTVDGTVQKSQKGKKRVFDPKMAIFSPHFKMLHEYFLYEND
jgi:hypothetical protein